MNIKLWENQLEKKMSGDPSLKDPVIFYSKELTNTKIVLLSLKGIKLNYVEKEQNINGRTSRFTYH